MLKIPPSNITLRNVPTSLQFIDNSPYKHISQDTKKRITMVAASQKPNDFYDGGFEVPESVIGFVDENVLAGRPIRVNKTPKYY